MVVAETAVTMTTVSPQRTVTAPSASLASLPDSKTMGVLPAWAVVVWDMELIMDKCHRLAAGIGMM
jgi:hypothetical protein